MRNGQAKGGGRSIAKIGGKDVAIYNPEKGLLTIAAAREGLRRARRARDQKGMRDAAEIKLRAEAEYTVWRDAVVVPSRKMGIAGPGRGKRGKQENRINKSKPGLPDGDPGDVIMYRWRKNLCETNDDGRAVKEDRIKMAKVIEETTLRNVRASEMESKGTERGTAGTGEFERYTPAEYIEAARAVMGSIDLDPASNKIAQRTVKATTYFTVKDDGLSKEWHGNVWLNPPYHRDLQPAFIDKMIEEVSLGHVVQAIMLVNNSTDTEWFRKAVEAATMICFTIGRVAFTTPSGEELAPTQGQAFFYFGRNADRFAEVFRRIGFGVTLTFKHQEQE